MKEKRTNSKMDGVQKMDNLDTCAKGKERKKSVNTNSIKVLTPQFLPMNFLGEGRWNDELIFSYDY